MMINRAVIPLLNLQMKSTFFEYIKSQEFIQNYIHKYIRQKDFGNKEYLLSNEYISDIEKLENEEYFFRPPFLKTRKKDFNEFRNIFVYRDKELFLLKIIKRGLHIYDSIFSEHSYSNTNNQGYKKIFDSIKENASLSQCYGYRFDVYHCMETVDTKILDSFIDKYINDDKQINELLHKIINDKRYVKNDQVYNDGKGLFAGSPLTQFFQDLYMTEFDKTISQNSVAFFRYCDDGIIYVKNESDLFKIQSLVSKELTNINQIINEKKTYVVKPNQSYNFLGATIQGNNVRRYLLLSSFKRIYSKEKVNVLRLKRKSNLSSFEAMKMFLKNTKFNDEIKVAKLCNDVRDIDAIKEINNMLKNMLKEIGSGKRTLSKNRISYDEIKKAGYINLVNVYYSLFKLLKNNKEKIK